MAASDHDEEGPPDISGHRDRLVLTTDRQVGVGPLRLETPATEPEPETADLEARLDALRSAIDAAPPAARVEDTAPAVGHASGLDEVSREILSRIIREEVDAALDVQLDERVRAIVRRELARSLSARRRG